MRVTGISIDGDEVTGILYRNLEHSTSGHLNVGAVITERSAIGLDDHLQAVLLNSLHFTSFRCARESHCSFHDASISIAPCTSHIFCHGFALRTICVLYHFNANKILTFVDHLYITLSHFVCSSGMSGDSLCGINTIDRVGKVRIGITCHGHHVVDAHYGHLENDTITRLDTVAIVTDGLSVGFYRQQDAIVLNSLHCTGLRLTRQCCHFSNYVLVGEVPRSRNAFCPSYKSHHGQQAERTES